MKKFLEKAIVSEVLEAVSCDKCGRALQKNEQGYFEDFVSFSKTWGYHSPLDGETHDFDLCIDCYLQWIGTFQTPPRNVR